jgi:hypothetical protein
MTIIIDDGTFLIGNSFVEISTADTFHASRLNTNWSSATEAQKEAALIRAFDFLSVQNWATDAFSSGIPLKIQNAQCIGALKEVEASGALQPDLTPGIKKESIDGVVSTEYFNEDSGGGGVVYTAVENMIKPYLRRPGMQRMLVRG